MRRSKLVINCAPTITPILKKEVESLGYENIRIERSGVTLEGGWKEVIHLNIHLRTASRVLWQIKSFEAKTPDRLYQEAKKIPWHKLIPKNGYLSIQSFVKNDSIRDTRFANLKLKDAVVDQMLEQNGIRPNSGKECDQTVLFLFWHGSLVHIYFDTSGQTIAKHNYRKIPFKAPIAESLASACLYSAGWSDAKGSFVNPMCGSGTLAIEAALIAAGRPPGLLRDNYGFMHIQGYEEANWKNALSKIEAKDEIDSPIIATDIDGKAIESAQENAKMAGVEKMIEFDQVPYEKTSVPNGPGIVMLNPEYGERLGNEKELGEVYAGIGNFFKKFCQAKTGYVFTGNSKLAKKIGLKAKSRTTFNHAKIDCKLLAYDLYAGSR
ncbi:MAG: class I SAM-dependent RNA methyltransferase [Verrucomicrobiota bacterium]